MRTPTFQKRFKSHVNKPTVEFQKLGNPFVDNHNTRTVSIQLNTRNIMEEKVVKATNELKIFGKEQTMYQLKRKLKLFSSANFTSSQVASKSQKKHN